MKEITPPVTEESEPEQDATEELIAIAKLSQAFKLLESVFETIENEDAINLVKLAMDNITDATNLILE